MVNYKKLYAYLVGEVDQALMLMDTGDLLQYNRVREILFHALQTVEDMYLEQTDDE